MYSLVNGRMNNGNDAITDPAKSFPVSETSFVLNDSSERWFCVYAFFYSGDNSFLHGMPNCRRAVSDLW